MEKGERLKVFSAGEERAEFRGNRGEKAVVRRRPKHAAVFDFIFVHSQKLKSRSSS